MASSAARSASARFWPALTSSTVRPGEHRGFGELVAGLLDPRVALLDEEPVALAFLDLHERPFAVELVAAQLEEELPFFQALAPIFERDPFAAVPDDDPAGPVVPGGNDPLEVAVLERVVLDLAPPGACRSCHRRGPLGPPTTAGPRPFRGGGRSADWRAACLWTTNRCPGTGDTVPMGSGDVSGDRLAR